MPQLIQFEGQTHEFPDDFTQEEISSALNSAYPPPKPEPPGVLASAGLGAAGSILPSAGFAAVAPPLAALGAEAGSFAGPVGSTVGAIAAPLIGGGLVAGAIGMGQEDLLKKYLPKNLYDKLTGLRQAAQEAHPTATTIGGVVGALPTMEAALPKLAELPMRAALGGAVGAIQPLVTEGKISGQDVLGGVLAGTFLGKSRLVKEPTVPDLIKDSSTTLPLAAKTAAAGEPAPKPETTGVPNATRERIVAESNQPEYPGVAPGQNLPSNQPQIRQEESGQAGGGNRPLGEPPPQVPEAGQTGLLLTPAETKPAPTTAPPESTVTLPETTIVPPESTVAPAAAEPSFVDRIRTKLYSLLDSLPAADQENARRILKTYEGGQAITQSEEAWLKQIVGIAQQHVEQEGGAPPFELTGQPSPAERFGVQTLAKGFRKWLNNFTERPKTQAQRAMRYEQFLKALERGEPTALVTVQPEEPTGVTPKNAGMNMFHAETNLVGEDILSYIMDTGGMMSKSAAKNQWSPERFAENESLWEDAPRLRPHHGGAIYGGQRTPDVVATQAAEDHLLKVDPETATEADLWPAIEAAAKKREGAFKGVRRQEQAMQEEIEDNDLLTKQEKSYLQTERASIDDPVKFTGTLPTKEDQPFASNIATIDRSTGTILINPQTYRQWLARIPEASRQQAVRSLLNEESLHLRVDDDSATHYWDNLSALEQRIAIRRYAGQTKEGKGIWTLEAAGLEPTMMGHEALRYRLQQLSRMTPREIAEAVGREKWTVRGLDAAEAVIRSLREGLGTRASREQRDIVDRMLENVGIARSAMAGTLGARLKDEPIPLERDRRLTIPDLEAMVSQSVTEKMPTDLQKYLADVLDVHRLEKKIAEVQAQYAPLRRAAMSEDFKRGVYGNHSSYEAVAKRQNQESLKYQELLNDVKARFNDDGPGILRDMGDLLNVSSLTLRPELKHWDIPIAKLTRFLEPTETAPAARLKERKETSNQGVWFLPPPASGQTLERGAFPIPKAADVEAVADAHLAQALANRKAPSFDDFQNLLKGRYGSAITKEQTFYTWEDAINKALMGASGKEIGQLMDSLGLRKEVAEALMPGAAKPFVGRMADPIEIPKTDQWSHLTAEQRYYMERHLAKKARKAPKPREFADPAMENRYAAIGAIKDKLSKEAGSIPKKPWERPTLGPEDVDQKYAVTEAGRKGAELEESNWDVATDRQFRTLTLEERADPAKVAELAVRGAAIEASGKGAPPRTVSRNVIGLRDNATGKIILVSAWRDPRSGPKVTNPLSTSEAGMKIDANLLKKFTPTVVIGLREPVKDFRQVFDNQEAFDKHFGDLAIEGTAGLRTSSFTGPQAGAVNYAAGLRGTGAQAPAEGLPAALYSEFVSPTARELTTPGRKPIQTGSMLYRSPRPTPPSAELLPIEAQRALASVEPSQPVQIPSPPPQEVLSGLGRPTGVIRTIGAPEKMGPGWPLREGLRTSTAKRAPAARLKDDLAEVGEDIAFGLHSTAEGLQNAIKKGAMERLLPATLDQADNNAHNDANAIEHLVRLKSADAKNKRGDPQFLAAANAVVESGGVLAKLDVYKQDVLTGMAKARAMAQSPNWRERRIGKAWVRNQEELLAELNFAQQHWNDPKLQETAAAITESLKGIRDLETLNGIDIAKEPNYLPHRWDATLWNGQSVMFQRVKVQGQKYREARSFADHYAASAAGPYIAATRDGASLVSHRYRQGLHRINQDAWLESLTQVHMPDGKPVGVESKMVKHGKNWRYDQPPSGYEAVHVGRSVIYVHEGAASLVRNLTARSQVQDWALTRNALHLAQVLKHNLLIGDFFHMGRVLYYGASLMGTKLGFKAGLSALDYRPQDLAEAVAKGVIRPEDAAWAQGLVDFGGQAITRQELLRKFTGANIGKIQDALYKDLLTNLSPVAGKVARIAQRVTDPSVGRYNRFLFDKLTRGVMAESLVNQYERLHKAHPNIPSQALADDIARDINNFFGNLGRQGALKSATMRDVARLFMLAPQWVEGLIRKEASFMGRISGVSRGLDAMGVGGRKGMPLLGATGQGVGAGLLFMFGLTQAINLITRRQFTWQNEEKEHKFDAYLKSFGGDKEGFWMSPMAIWNELAHDLYRFSFSKPTFADAVDQVAANKESPLFRALSIMATGRTGAGLITTTTPRRIAEAGKAMLPVPITFGRYGQSLGHAVAPGLVSPVPPGQIERQTFGSMGIKVEPQASPVSEMGRVAQDWMKQQGIDRSTGWTQGETTDPTYGKLRMALRNDDEKEAKNLLAGLRENHSDKAIIQAMGQWAKKGFTTKAAEGRFIASLSPGQEQRYWEALDSKRQTLEKFYDFLNRH